MQTFASTLLLKTPSFGFWIYLAWNFMLPFSLRVLTPQGVRTFTPTLFLKTVLSALLGTLPSPLQPETDFCSTFHTTTELALEANFRARRLHNQISRFWPAARNDYFPNWDPFTNPSFPGLAASGPLGQQPETIAFTIVSVLTPPWAQNFVPALLWKSFSPCTLHNKTELGPGR